MGLLDVHRLILVGQVDHLLLDVCADAVHIHHGGRDDFPAGVLALGDQPVMLFLLALEGVDALFVVLQAIVIHFQEAFDGAGKGPGGAVFDHHDGLYACVHLFVDAGRDRLEGLHAAVLDGFDAAAQGLDGILAQLNMLFVRIIQGFFDLFQELPGELRLIIINIFDVILFHSAGEFAVIVAIAVVSHGQQIGHRLVDDIGHALPQLQQFFF